MTVASEVCLALDQLPPLPDTVFRLIQLFDRPDSTVEEIVECLRYDAVVTADVLRLCNSAHFGLGRSVTSLHEAIRYLGSLRMLQIVLARHAGPLLAREQQGYGLGPGRLWQHSVAVALASAGFAKRILVQDNRLAFTGGLLHDIGKIALNAPVGAALGAILRTAEGQGISFVEAEERVLDWSHEKIGADLARSWGLPEPIVRCIQYHHDPGPLAPPDPLVDAVHLANSVCLMFGIGLGVEGLLSRAEPAVLRRHGLNETTCEEVGMEMLAELHAVEDLFAGPSQRPA